MDDLELRCDDEPDTDWLAFSACNGNGTLHVVASERAREGAYDSAATTLSRPDAARLRDWLTAWLGEW